MTLIQSTKEKMEIDMWNLQKIITATKVFKQANQTTLTRKATQDALAKTVDGIG